MRRATSKLKQEQARIAEDMNAYLMRGGKIKKLKQGESSNEQVPPTRRYPTMAR
jgi:hypothetical protein